MADTTVNTPDKATEDINKAFDYDKRVYVRNTSGMDNYFRAVEKQMDIFIAKNGRTILSRSEIIAQCDKGNTDFTGYNRDGKHAAFYIEDKETRVRLGFESEDGSVKQVIVDDKVVISLFDAPSDEVFLKRLESEIVTQGERETLRNVIKSGKVDAHGKIEIAEKFLKGEAISIEKKAPSKVKA